MATKTELEISRDRITIARESIGVIFGAKDHAERIINFWSEVIERWKYPQGQARHGGRLWRKRMDEQITMELSDLCTYWPTMLQQLDEIDELHVRAHTDVTKALTKLDGFDGRADLGDLAEIRSWIVGARFAIQKAMNVRDTGNAQGKTEEEK